MATSLADAIVAGLAQYAWQGPATGRYPELLRAVPKGWFSSHTEVFDEAGSLVATIDLSSWRENARIEVAGTGYLARHEPWAGEFVLETEDGQRVALAEKPSAFRERFLLEHRGQRYEFAKQRGWGKAFLLTSEDAARAGTIRQTGAFGSEITVDLPDELSIPVQIMILWLAMILRRRQAAATGGAAAGS